MFIYVCIFVYANIYMYIYIGICICACVCMYVYIYIYIYIYIYTFHFFFFEDLQLSSIQFHPLAFKIFSTLYFTAFKINSNVSQYPALKSKLPPKFASQEGMCISL